MTTDLREGARIDEELVAQHRLELPGVHLRNEDAIEALQERPHVARHRPDVTDVNMRHVEAATERAPHRLVDWSEGRAPADNREPRAFAAKADILLRNALGHLVHLGSAGVGHLLVCSRAVI